ncbi:MAG: pentapeptide repeat-containing protein [Phycisphaerales bacterium JB039]
MIAYALEAFGQRAAGVLTRVRDAPDAGLLAGDKRLSIRVLHAMAERDSIRTIDQAVCSVSGDAVPAIEEDCLRRLSGSMAAGHVELTEPLRILWAARALMRLLESDRPGPHARWILTSALPGQFLRVVAREGCSRRAVRRLARAADRSATAVAAASILARIDRAWRPGRCRRLPGADFEGVDWANVSCPEIRLQGANLRAANLRRADLRKADLTVASASNAVFAEALLEKARCAYIRAEAADFDCAHLGAADLLGAHLSRARLSGARLYRARLNEANLDGADCSNIDCACAQFSSASLDGTDLTRAQLREARLEGADFRRAVIDFASLEQASLIAANLEGVGATGLILDHANLSKALLTGASLPAATMTFANLGGAGLANVELEGADLRNADFAGASFHLGSSRSGLVGSVIAGEGSRTGYYTDDFDDRSFKDPEAIRKANLCGADLRCAAVTMCDFYLVDLRRARYDNDQAAHFKRCGAIL